MNRRHIRAILSLAIVFLTIAVFTVYFRHHPEIKRQLAHTHPLTLTILGLLYLFFVGTIALITHATIRVSKYRMPAVETAHLTMYSSIINFFGPLQSGPAFRGLYLKKKHGVSLKNYGYATLAYYAVYGLLSLACLSVTLLGLWLLPLLVAGLVAAYVVYRHRFERRSSLDFSALGYLTLATSLQVLVLIIIFYVELQSLGHVSVTQAITYAGAANLALFVSVTPGAIGFRESFLYFSRHLHHISNDTIVAANVLDRSMYISMLVLMSVYLFASHARSGLRAVVKK